LASINFNKDKKTFAFPVSLSSSC